MKILNFYNLNFNQHEVDFVNIDVNRDSKLFVDGRAIIMNVDPRYFSMRKKFMNFSRELNSCLVDIGQYAKRKRAYVLFDGFTELSASRLGYCEAGFRGNSVGRNSLRKDLVEMLLKNSALSSGVIGSFHQVSLVTKNISVDRLSDATTQILAKELADYTYQQCVELGLESQQLDSFTLSYFDDATSSWVKGNFLLPFSVEFGKKAPILLIPKVFVRDEYSAARTFNQFLDYILQGPMFTEEYFVQNNVVATGKRGKYTLKDKRNWIKSRGGKEYVVDFLVNYKSDLFLIDFEDKYRHKLPPELTDQEIENIVNCGKKTGCDLAS